MQMLYTLVSCVEGSDAQWLCFQATALSKAYREPGGQRAPTWPSRTAMCCLLSCGA